MLGYYAIPLPATGFLAFNSTRAPFSDPDVRRAAALALNRQALAALWGAVPTDEFLPPPLREFRDRQPSPLSGPDLDGARSLMNGRKRTATMAIEEACDPCRMEAEVVRADLARIGIAVHIREVTDPTAVALTPDAEIDLLSLETPFGYLDPATFLAQMLLGEMPRAWLPDGVTREVERLFRLQGSRRRIAAALLADRLATGDVPIAATRTLIGPHLLAPTLGCREFPPLGYGVDLAGLCLTQGS
jgi:ABC-type transport system substrate-binding protein